MNAPVSAPLDPAALPIKPTKETYERLQQAHEYFNKALFGGTLPNALITFQRRRHTFGYFAGGRFENDAGVRADEIALNPGHFASRSLIEILGTLVHEMTHQWQHHEGQPGRGRYHNKEWAEKMKAIGLHPSDTGLEHGKETGETVSHYIVAGGPFEVAAGKLLARGFVLTWKDAVEPVPAGGETDGGGDGEGGAAPVIPKSGKRVRYCCPVCDLKAWAKHDVRLLCGTDNELMLPSE